MTIRISPARLDTDTEKRIITNWIVDDEYAKAIAPIAEPDFFDIPYCKTISFWLKEYFKSFGASPGKMISDIFNVKKAKMSQEDIELIGDFLTEISNKYLVENEKRNVPYLVQTSKEYFKKKYYERMAEKLQANSRLGNVTECEKIVAQKKEFRELQVQYTNLHDEDTVEKIIENKNKNILFTIDGDLGELIGPIRRGELIAVLGRTNIGKSFFLREMLFQALLNRFKCVEFNFEMQVESVGFRHFKRILGMGDESKQYLFPMFDCQHNAIGTCTKKERKGKIPLVTSSGEIPVFGEHDRRYIPCSVCRGTKDYKVFTWHEPLYKNAINSSAIKGGVKAFKMMYGDNLRTCCFPKFTATIGDCEHQLDMMDHLEGFYPDFGIWDYDDIVRAETKFIDPLDASDEIYKRLGGLLQQRKMAGFIGMQLNRTGAKKKKASTLDVSGVFKKMMHIDTCILLDASKEESENGILRASVGKMRDGEFKASREIKILQQLGTGQSLLDSSWDDVKNYEDGDN